MPKDTLPRIVCCQVSRGPSSAPGRGSWKHTGPLSWPRADPGQDGSGQHHVLSPQEGSCDQRLFRLRPTS